MNKYIFSLLAALSVSNSFAETAISRNTDADRARTENAIEAALAVARNRVAEEKISNQRKMLPIDNTQKDAADIAKLAERFQSVSVVSENDQPVLIAFISTSMPSGALERIGHELVKYGGIMVLRGIRGDLGVKNALNETMRYLQPAAKSGATIQIDPNLFKSYQVKRVPAYVIANNSGDCNANSCDVNPEIIYGDVSVTYALEEMVRKGGVSADIAKTLLKTR
jgi:type-F conjugative transfer system pilin assembly protein TrbC